MLKSDKCATKKSDKQWLPKKSDKQWLPKKVPNEDNECIRIQVERKDWAHGMYTMCVVARNIGDETISLYR